MITRLDLNALTLAHRGLAWEHFRQSTNVEDHRNRYSASEDGTMYDSDTGRTVPDASINQDPGGWRDDQETGNRTWIGPDGESDTVERPDGSVTPARSVWDESSQSRQNDGNPQTNDFNFGQFPGGETTGSQSGGGESGGYSPKRASPTTRSRAGSKPTGPRLRGRRPVQCSTIRTSGSRSPVSPFSAPLRRRSVRSSSNASSRKPRLREPR